MTTIEKPVQGCLEADGYVLTATVVAWLFLMTAMDILLHSVTYNPPVWRPSGITRHQENGMSRML
jgi:hypothetical protein